MHNKKNFSFIKSISTSLSTGLILAFLSSAASASEQKVHFCGPEAPEVAKSVNTLIPALYGVVSGKAGSNKDWALLKQLFAPEAIVTPVFHNKEGDMVADIKSVDEFIALNKEIFKNQDFYETEVAREVFEFGHMTHVLSHYESRDKVGAEPYAQGINSFQILNDGRRLCVISVTWDSDNIIHPIPKHAFKMKKEQ